MYEDPNSFPRDPRPGGRSNLDDPIAPVDAADTKDQAWPGRPVLIVAIVIVGFVAACFSYCQR